MSDFVPVLIAATVMLLVLFMAFGGLIIIGEEPQPELTTTSVIDYKVNLGANFTVADYQLGTEYIQVDGNVSEGIVSSAKKIRSFEVRDFDEITHGKVIMDIEDTNLYGPLIIMINDNVVFNNVTLIGTHSVKFNKNFLNETDNQLVIRAGGSGWRIWAPTTYIFDLGVYGEIYDISHEKVKFNLTYVPSYAGIRVYVASRQGTGEIEVKVNGYRVYKGRGTAFKTFDTDILKEGENVAEFKATSGSRFKIQSAYITFE